MRIPHNLVRAASGHYSFRQRVPGDLHAVVGLRLIKRALNTADTSCARMRATVRASSYAQAYDLLRERSVEKFGKKDLEDLVERLSKGAGRNDLTLHRTQAADGTITERWQMDSEEDVKLFRQAQAQANAAEVAAIGVLDPTPVRRTHASRPQVTETISLEKARDAWLASIKPRTLPKTYTIKLAAVESLVSFLGPKSKLHTVSRPDLARWYQHLRDNGASTPTLTNKQSYVGRMLMSQRIWKVVHTALLRLGR